MVVPFAFAGLVGKRKACGLKGKLMNVRFKVFGAALLALALSLALPALASSHDSTQSFQELKVSDHGPTLPPDPWVDGVRLLNLIALLGLGAAVVVTYKYPVAGTVPPTAQQSSGANVIIAEVAWLDADLTALVTHNFGLATAAGFAGGRPGSDQFFPIVTMYNSGVSTIAAPVSVALTSGSVITLTKTSILGTNGTIIVMVDRRQSIGR